MKWKIGVEEQNIIRRRKMITFKWNVFLGLQGSSHMKPHIQERLSFLRSVEEEWYESVKGIRPWSTEGCWNPSQRLFRRLLSLDIQFYESNIDLRFYQNLPIPNSGKVKVLNFGHQRLHKEDITIPYGFYVSPSTRRLSTVRTLLCWHTWE